MGRQLRVVPRPDPAHGRAPDLRESVRTAIAAMTWLDGATDDALKALALRQAEEIETAIDRAQLLSDLYDQAQGDSVIYKRLQMLEAQCEVVKVVGLIGPQLAAVLRELGGTPAARKALRADNPVGGRLAALRNSAGQG